ncbi:MAG: beta-lactamase family protein, partial [bacterium]|nr:beta-lactamase family protein [bacterium]
AIGWRDAEQRLPMEKDTLFHMASNTKPVVAAAILMLAEEGKLALDDPVSKHLAAFDNYRSGGITIRHLLTHTSGLRIPTIFLKPLLDNPTLQAEVARFGKIGAEVEPGTSYQYNNPGYNTLGAIIEVASGQPLSQFLKENIYDPLEMRDSSNHETNSPVERLGVVYKRRKGAWRIFSKPDSPPRYPFVRASGGMISIAANYFRFCQIFLASGAPILSAESARAATSPQTRHAYSREELSQRDSFYGYGWTVRRDGVYSHGGSEGTYVWVDPNTKVIGLYFTQSPNNTLRRRFQKIVEAAVQQP